ncbi:MAG: pyocin activator PrtN family protein [Beijerinckiaceae bacterium]
MNTVFLLLAQYDGRAIIPLDLVCRDYFSMTPEKFLRKQLAGEIDLPVVRIDPTSQKTAKGVHVNDLAAYLDKRVEAARKECEQLQHRDAA